MTSISEKNLVDVRQKIDSQVNRRLFKKISNRPWINSERLRGSDVYDEWNLSSFVIFRKLDRSLNVVALQIKNQFYSW
jgi:hypothetical protein